MCLKSKTKLVLTIFGICKQLNRSRKRKALEYVTESSKDTSERVFFYKGLSKMKGHKCLRQLFVEHPLSVVCESSLNGSIFALK